MGKRAKGTASHTADTGAVSGIKGFAGIPRCVVESAAYRHLQLIDRAILVEIVNRMKGDNNGKIHMSYAEIATALNRKNQAPIGSSIARLMHHGFLDISAESVWQERKAREYRLTFVNTSDSSGRPIKATNDYVNWKPGAKFDTTYVVAERPKSATTFVAGGIGAATDVVATGNAKLPKTLEGSATNGVVPIFLPYPSSENGDCEQSNSVDSNPEIADDPKSAALNLRGKILVYWRGLSPRRQLTWAKAHGVSRDDVRHYCHGDPDHIPPAKVAAMVLAIRNEAAAKRRFNQSGKVASA